MSVKRDQDINRKMMELISSASPRNMLEMYSHPILPSPGLTDSPDDSDTC